MYEDSEQLNILESDKDKPSYGSNNNSEENSGIDILEKTVGGFGKWQLKITILLSLLKIPLAWTQLNIVFIAPHIDFWCKPPEQYAELPILEWKSMILVTSEQLQNVTYPASCFMQNIFNNQSNTTILPCPWGYDYNTKYSSSTIVAEWNLVCEKSILVEVTQTTTMLGILLGMVVFGTAADKFGRRTVLLVAIFLHILSGIVSSLSPWYSLFLLFKFISAWASSGLMAISFVMVLEVVGGSWRTSISILTNIPWGLGYSIVAIISYYVRNWRHLQLIQFMLSSFFFTYYWLIPESPRWLISVNRQDEAVQILKKATKENRNDIHNIRQIVRESQTDSEVKSVNVIHIFKYHTLRKRALLLSVKWFANGIVYFGLYQLSGTVSENVYLSVIIVGAISIPGNICAVLIVKKFGRKISLAVANLFTAVCVFAIIFVTKSTMNYSWLETFLLGTAIFGLTISYPTLHLLSGECYPTVLRNSTVSMNMMCSKLGGMLSPFIVSLALTHWHLPLILFGIMSVIEIFPLLFLPETLKMKLPESIDDVEKS